jgi:DNA-binding transcriptional MocR family regulator
MELSMNYVAYLSRAAGTMQESAIRKMGAASAGVPDVISFAPGYPAPETFPWEDFREITSELLGAREATTLQYGPTRGFRPLLEAILGVLRSRGIVASLEQLLVTTGSQQGLDLVARVLLDPGDVALVELPAYTGAITAFRNVQAELAGVRQEADRPHWRRSSRSPSRRQTSARARSISGWCGKRSSAACSPRRDHGYAPCTSRSGRSWSELSASTWVMR